MSLKNINIFSLHLQNVHSPIRVNEVYISELIVKIHTDCVLNNYNKTINSFVSHYFLLDLITNRKRSI